VTRLRQEASPGTATTLEQMARSMFDATWRGTCYTWEMESPVGRKHYLEQARAGLEFLKKVPSVVEAVATMSISYGNDEIWNTMIDAILNEKED
jgi:hypothetical protein